MTSVPLAKDGGITRWVLVDKNLPPDQRSILCSCESFRKRSLVGDIGGNVTELVIHGIASVFCDPAYRHRGYAGRMMRELARELQSWQVEPNECVGSVLYSDIGKNYYASFGWHPIPNNSHIEFPSLFAPKLPRATHLLSEDLEKLCKEDETMVRKTMASTSNGNIRMMLVPDYDHMLWHHRKEEFVCDRLFGKKPQFKGAITGQPGNRVWVVWAHRFYGDPESVSSGNTLYILRLVIENQNVVSTFSSEGRESPDNAEQLRLHVEQLKAILQAAQAEAAEWKLTHVTLWDPAPLVQELIEQAGIQHCKVERQKESIACLLWYGKSSGMGDSPEWIGNEKFAWC